MLWIFMEVEQETIGLSDFMWKSYLALQEIFSDQRRPLPSFRVSGQIQRFRTAQPMVASWNWVKMGMVQLYHQPKVDYVM